MITISRTRRIGLAVTGMLVAGGALLAATPTIASTMSCSTPALSQPFLPWGDSHEYTLAPGQSADNFTASGWTLMGGARVITVTLADGRTGRVLDLPSGATAISPQVCLNSSYPTARAIVRTPSGAAGVSLNVSYAGQRAFRNLGRLRARHDSWTASNQVNLQTSRLTSWQLARFQFANSAHGNDTQLYNFYIDPYSKNIIPPTARL
jgi:hypothetical protein